MYDMGRELLLELAQSLGIEASLPLPWLLVLKVREKPTLKWKISIQISANGRAAKY